MPIFFFRCEICNKFFADRKKFYLHKRRHDQASTISFTCDYCGRKFRSKETIRRHLFVMHIETDPKFECDICHKRYVIFFYNDFFKNFYTLYYSRFQLKTLLRNHQYSVHREKKANLSCEFCGKMFNVKAIFEKHMLLHGDKTKRLAHRKQCDHCGEWLLTKSGLYYHEVIHKSDIQKCGQCGMELPHKLALSAHIRKNHREPKHKCKFCDKSFDILSKLRVNYFQNPLFSSDRISFVLFCCVTSGTRRRSYSSKCVSLFVLFESIHHTVFETNT